MNRAPHRVALAVVAAACPGVAAASALEEVMVTARKVAEPASEVPLSIRTLTREEIERSSVRDLYSLAARTPGLSFESTWGGGNSYPTLRGQFSPSLGDTVGVFVDGVYQASRSALDVELLDFEHVEVVSGPQSAMFGHSAFAGAISYISARPTESLTGSVALEGGSDQYVLARGVISGPLSERWRGRLAVGTRSFDGDRPNTARRGDELGSYEHQAVAGTVATSSQPDARWDASLSGRYEDDRFGHPPAASLGGADYNCGSQDPASGLWSYFCGAMPADGRADISPGLPESQTQVGQVLLKLGFALGEWRLESETSWYDASASLVRDFDASSAGTQYGVCTAGVNCAGPPGVPRLVDRLVYANQVTRDVHDTRQWSQEFRLHGASGPLDWMVGAVGFDTLDRVTARFGTARGNLAGNERLTAVLPATPQQVGPTSIANLSLVDDPAQQQVLRQRVESRQRTYALFGALDYAATDHAQLRAELRATHERFELDSEVVNFQPSFGRAIDPQDFNDVTARLSVDYRLSSSLRTYLSAAKGSRSGGINPLPGLPPEEQVFEPESNWTYELGMRHTGDGLVRSLDATLYYIDWSDTQINGLPSRPGLSNLIILNTAGITTRGLEFSATLVPLDGLRAEFSYSYADPEFRAGSDDYGSSAFCGLTAQVQESSFCVVGPPREPTPNSPALVPYLDGNRPGRSPRVTWHAALVGEAPETARGWRPWMRVDVNHQDDVYERQINGARFGERTLLDARTGLTLGHWSLEAWGTNLTDESYVRASFSRLPIFYPTQPRPLDIIFAEGRRYGVTVRWSF